VHADWVKLHMKMYITHSLLEQPAFSRKPCSSERVLCVTRLRCICRIIIIVQPEHSEASLSSAIWTNQVLTRHSPQGGVFCPACGEEAVGDGLFELSKPPWLRSDGDWRQTIVALCVGAGKIECTVT